MPCKNKLGNYWIKLFSFGELSWAINMLISSISSIHKLPHFCAQCRAQWGVWTHDCQIKTRAESKSGLLNGLSHPAPFPQFFKINITCIYNNYGKQPKNDAQTQWFLSRGCRSPLGNIWKTVRTFRFSWYRSHTPHPPEYTAQPEMLNN